MCQKAYAGPLVADYSFDEAGGTAILNSVNNGNNYAGLGYDVISSESLRVIPGAGDYGGALQFLNASDYAAIYAPEQLDSSEGFTVSVWIYLKPEIDQRARNIIRHEDSWRIYSNRRSCSGDPVICKENRIYFQMNLSGTMRNQYIWNKTAVADESWHHVAVVWDGQDGFIYIDGNHDTDTAGNLSGSLTHGSADMWLGNYHDDAAQSNQHLNGKLDRLHIWSRALSPGEIRDLYDLESREVVEAPLAVYPMDEGTGDNVANTINSFSDAQLISGSWVPHGSGSSLAFHEDADVAVINNASSLNASNGLSVSAWVYLDSTSDTPRRFIINREACWRVFIQNYGGGNKVFFQNNVNGAWASNWLIGDMEVPGDGWHHIAVVWDRNERSIYVDGTFDKSGPAVVETIPVKHDTFEIGNFQAGTNYEFDGQIDDLRIWGRPLDADEIRELHDNPGPEIKRTPVAIFPMDEGTGDIAGNTGNTGSGAQLLSGIWEPGYIGSASLGFTGHSDIAVIPDASPFDTADAVTVSAWIYLYETDVPWRFIVNREQSWRVFVKYIDGKNRLHFQTKTDGVWGFNWLVGEMDVTPGRWHHVAAVWDGDTRSIYVDGVFDSSEASVAVSIPANSPTIEIGNFVAGGEMEFDGKIDDLRIYGRALSESEIRAIARKGTYTPAVSLPKAVAVSGTDQLSLRVDNKSKVPVSGTLEVDGMYYGIQLEPGHFTDIPVEIAGSGPGEGSITYTWIPEYGYQEPVTAVLKFWIPTAWNTAPAGAEETRVHTLAASCSGMPTPCTDVNTTGYFFGNDGGLFYQVVSDPVLGTYIESGNNKFNEIAFRYDIDSADLNKPHLLRIHYPDDKERTADIQSWSDHVLDLYNMQSGYLTGSPHPLTGKMKTMDMIVYPIKSEQYIDFMTWENGKPAAMHHVDIFKINNAGERVPASGISSNKRHIGFYYEDPMLAMHFGARTTNGYEDFQYAVDNVTDYMNYAGLDMLSYPVVWYDGPLYNSSNENSRIVRKWTHQPGNGFIDIILDRFKKENMIFLGAFNVHSLSTLNLMMNADEDSVIAGDDTINLVLYDRVGNDNRFVQEYTFHTDPPKFNILRPEVQQAFLALTGELLDEYKDNRAFGGIVFHLTKVSALWLGSLEGDYSDWTMGEYVNDTGSAVLSETTSEMSMSRFTERHTWLLNNEKEQWIDWRCSRLHEFYSAVHQMIYTANPDLRFVLELHSPPNGHYYPDVMEWGAGKSVDEFFREAGVCTDMYSRSEMPALTIQKVLFPQGYRFMRGRAGKSDADSIKSRYMDFSDEMKAMRPASHDYFGIVMHQTYWEASDSITQTVAGLGGFNGTISYRASAVPASGRSFLEYFNYSLSGFNADEILVGGFSPGTKGYGPEMREFAKVFRSLPASRHDWQFIDTSALNMDISAQYLADAGGLGWLAISGNQSEKKLIKVRFGSTVSSVFDIAAGAGEDELYDSIMYTSLKGYGLNGFEIAPAGSGVTCIEVDDDGIIDQEINLLCSGGFETGFANWDREDDVEGVISSIDDTVFYTGSKSSRIEFTNFSGNYQQISQTVSVIPGAAYVLEGFIRTDGFPNGSGMRIEAVDSLEQHYKTDQVKGTSDWTYVDEQFTVPYNVNEVTVRMIRGNSNAVSATAWFDDIKLIKVAQ